MSSSSGGGGSGGGGSVARGGSSAASDGEGFTGSAERCHCRLIPLDQLTVNEYARGVGLAPHIDTHIAFEGAVLSLSLAGPVIMEFRRLKTSRHDSSASPATQSAKSSPVAHAAADGASEDTDGGGSAEPCGNGNGSTPNGTSAAEGNNDATSPRGTEDGARAPAISDADREEGSGLAGAGGGAVAAAYEWEEEERRALFLPARSLLLLTGEARYAWSHYIPNHKADRVGGETIQRAPRRVSFTFRRVRLDPTCDCPFPRHCDAPRAALSDQPSQSPSTLAQDSLPDRQPDRHPDRQADRQADRRPDRQPDRQPDSLPDRQPVRQPDRHPDRQADRQPVRQADLNGVLASSHSPAPLSTVRGGAGGAGDICTAGDSGCCGKQETGKWEEGVPDSALHPESDQPVTGAGCGVPTPSPGAAQQGGCGPSGRGDADAHAAGGVIATENRECMMASSLESHKDGLEQSEGEDGSGPRQRCGVDDGDLRAPDIESKSDLRAPDIEVSFVHRVYDAIAPHFSATRFAKWPKVAAFLHSLPPHSLVLDAGCGNGKYLDFLAANLPLRAGTSSTSPAGIAAHNTATTSSSTHASTSGSRSRGRSSEESVAAVGIANGIVGALHSGVYAVGVDMSAPLVGICRARGFEVGVADTLCLPFRDCAFDAVLSVAVLHHLSSRARRQAAVRELLRVVRRGGHVLLTVWAREQEDPKLLGKWTPLIGRHTERWVGPASSSDGVVEGDVSKGEGLAARERVEGSILPSLSEDIEDAAGPRSRSSDSGLSATVSHTMPSRVPGRNASESETPAHEACRESEDSLQMNGTEANTGGVESGVAQEFLVPWHLPMHRVDVGSEVTRKALATGFARRDDVKGAVVYNRFYHVFTEGELEKLAEDAGGCDVADKFYDKSNWCAILRKL